MLVVFVVLAAALLLPALVDLMRRPDLRRVGIRNLARRPLESMLIVFGTALGTAIIAGALMVGDTFDTSIRDRARTELGEIDEVVELVDGDDLAAAVELLAEPPIDGVDGLLGISLAGAALATEEGPDRRAEPFVRVAALHPASLSSADPGAFDVTALAPGPGDVVLSVDLASDLGVTVGDRVIAYAFDTGVALTVTALAPAEGLSGFAPVWVAPDLLAQADAVGADPIPQILISNDGGVFDSTDGSRAILDTATNRLFEGSLFADDARTVKLDLLEFAEADGAEITTIFTAVGGFSVAAGVLLLVNLMVMLAEERKPNLGVMRAIGWKRSALVRAFGVEGALYSIAAAVVGAVLGIGVGWVIVKVTRGIIADPDSDLELIFALEPSSLLLAALSGVVIAMASIWATGWRISRLNIISAIRDLPEPRTARRQIVSVLVGLGCVALGTLFMVVAMSAESVYLAIVGVPLALLGIALVAKNFFPPAPVALVTGLAVVGWGALFFSIMPESFTTDVAVPFFLVFGLIVVAGGVAITSVAGPSLQHALKLSDRPMLAPRLGMAFPVARILRTAASLGMYSLIIFSLTFLGVLSAILADQGDVIAEEIAAGHDILVQSNRSFPVSAADLESVDGIVRASPVMAGEADWYRTDLQGAASSRWRASGIDPSFVEVGSPVLSERAERFASDRDAMVAVASDPTVTIVPSWFLGADGYEPAIGDRVTATSPDGERTFEIVGVVENDWAFAGPWVSVDALREVVPHAVARRAYVQVADGVDGDVVAEEIQGRFVVNGADAETFTARVGRFIEDDLGFFNLLSGYLLLGLVIGIAGLAVTLFRAVRERRRQIGMLRAMGMPARSIRRWFLTEAMFISTMGIVTGVGLGLLTSYLVLSRSSAFDGDALPFAVPWGTLAFVIGVPLVASALAALIPARRAAALRPAEALRLAD